MRHTSIQTCRDEKIIFVLLNNLQSGCVGFEQIRNPTNVVCMYSTILCIGDLDATPKHSNLSYGKLFFLLTKFMLGCVRFARLRLSVSAVRISCQIHCSLRLDAIPTWFKFFSIAANCMGIASSLKIHQIWQRMHVTLTGFRIGSNPTLFWIQICSKGKIFCCKRFSLYFHTKSLGFAVHCI